MICELNAADLDQLVKEIHLQGLSQVALTLNLFLCNATKEQKQALVNAINNLVNKI